MREKRAAFILVLATAAVLGSGCTYIQDLWDDVRGSPCPEWDEQAVEDASTAISAPRPDVNRNLPLAEKLVAVYLFDCVEDPRIRPAGRSVAIRALAGRALLAGIERHLDYPAKEYTAWLAAFHPRLNTLHETAIRKCGQEKLGELDPDGTVKKVLELTSKAGFEAAQKHRRMALMGALQEAAESREVEAVVGWREACKIALYDDEEFCLPAVIRTLYDLGEIDRLVASFFHYGSEWSSTAAGYVFLDKLAKSVGQETVTATLLTYIRKDNRLMNRHEHDGYAALHILDWLSDHDAFAGCRNKELLSALLESDRNGPLKAACRVIGKHRCADKKVGEKLIFLLSHENGWVRRQAALALGELGTRSALKKLGAIRFTDPFWDDGCSCFPVRNAAKKAYETIKPKKGRK